MRLLIVSNRLPMTMIQAEGQLHFQKSAGGLVSGLSSFLESLPQALSKVENYIWVGSPGLDVDACQKEEISKRLHDECHAHPVWVSQQLMDRFYNGFCNKIIWPLFHYFPSLTALEEDLWNDYNAVNEAFCEAVLQVAKDDDIVWVHDYHLFCLPLMLKKKKPSLKIGFFLHIPFPSFEMFRLLPKTWCVKILNGILGADLVGFHTYDYTQYFIRCCLRILGLDHNMGKLVLEDRLVLVDTFPMGIDYQRYYEAAKSAGVIEEAKKIRHTLGVEKIVLSIDRLDYTKGIFQRLKGFEKFLEDCPQWRGKTVLLLILVPSRIAVDQYQHMKDQIDQTIGLINGKFGQMAWNPINYQYRFVDFETLVALYSLSDVALVTPLRDGMNLVAKEYVASRQNQDGVLILSEMAGSAHELGEAVTINPNIHAEIAAALPVALEMPAQEQKSRMLSMQARLKQYNVIRWADDFLQKLDEVHKEQIEFNAKMLGPLSIKHLVSKFQVARHRLLFFDYDGTMVPFNRIPSQSKPSKDLLSILERLSTKPETKVVIISGRDRQTMESWFGKLPLNFVAEHGTWTKKQGESWQQIKPLRNDWKAQILPILQMASARLPGAFVEEKEFSLAWHYRGAHAELASIRNKELLDNLVHLTATIDLQVLIGHKVIEIRNAGVSKGMAALQFVEEKHDFILAIGDDYTDEELFKALPISSYSIRVGRVPTFASFNLANHTEVLSLLEDLAAVDPSTQIRSLANTG